MLCEEHDLPDMVCVMRKLAVYRLDDRVRLAANIDRFRKILSGQRPDIIEQRLPASLPKIHQRFARVADSLKFQITVPRRLLAVRCQKIRPTRMKIPGDVLYDNSDRIRLGVDRSEKLFVGYLFNRTFRKLFITAEGFEGVGMVVLNYGIVYFNVETTIL